MTPDTKRALEDKFKKIIAERSQKDHETGCIVWTGSHNGSGYGRFQIGTKKSGTAKTYMAHWMPLPAPPVEAAAIKEGG